MFTASLKGVLDVVSWHTYDFHADEVSRMFEAGRDIMFFLWSLTRVSNSSHFPIGGDI
jgi:hypothetical protein